MKRALEHEQSSVTTPHAADVATSAPATSGTAAAAASPAPLALGGLAVGAAETQAEAEADRAGTKALERLRRYEDDPSPHVHGEREQARDAEAPTGVGARIGYAGGALDDETTQAIEARRGRGRQLEPDVLRRMSTAFGADLSHLRIHDDATAADLSHRISAHAFTTGSDMFFGKGVYAPETPVGEQVLAHELAHTLQPDQVAGPASEVAPVSTRRSAQEIGDGTPLVRDTLRGLRTIRRKPWDSLLPKTASPIDIYINTTDLMEAVVYELPDGGSHETKAKAVWALVENLSHVDLPPQNSLFTTKALKKLLRGKVLDEANFAGKKQEENTYRNAINPFTIRGTARYGPSESIVEIYWQFSRASYGYVTTIIQDGKKFTMHPERGNAAAADTLADEKDPLRNAQWQALIDGRLDAEELTSFYGSAHDTSHPDESIIDHANRDLLGISDVGLTPGRERSETDQLVAEARTNLRRDHQTLDGVAKIAGEGARFRCVRALPNDLRDSSRFYISADGQTRSVTLQTLWGSWASVFKAAWNIPDGDVARALRENRIDHVVTPDDDFTPTKHDYKLVEGGGD